MAGFYVQDDNHWFSIISTLGPGYTHLDARAAPRAQGPQLLARFLLAGAIHSIL